MVAPRLEKIKGKYEGKVGEEYEGDRRHTTHWQREQQIVDDLLDEAEFEEEILILDVPTGTGRFFPYFKARRYKTIGVDASPDMLAEAKQKAIEIEIDYGDVELHKGDITDLQLEDDSVDLSICIRIMNWFDFSNFQKALSELRRVSSRFIIVGVRMSSGSADLGFSSWLKYGTTGVESKAKRGCQANATIAEETDIRYQPLRKSLLRSSSRRPFRRRRTSRIPKAGTCCR